MPTRPATRLDGVDVLFGARTCRRPFVCLPPPRFSTAGTAGTNPPAAGRPCVTPSSRVLRSLVASQRILLLAPAVPAWPRLPAWLMFSVLLLPVLTCNAAAARPPAPPPLSLIWWPLIWLRCTARSGAASSFACAVPSPLESTLLRVSSHGRASVLRKQFQHALGKSSVSHTPQVHHRAVLTWRAASAFCERQGGRICPQRPACRPGPCISPWSGQKALAPPSPQRGLGCR